MLDPPPAAELSSFYPESYWYAPDQTITARLEEIYRRFVLRDHVRFVAQALERSGETGPVLDVGCGGGLFLALLRERGFEVQGLDSSPKGAALARQRHRIEVVCGTLEDAALPPSRYRAVCMFHVLEHLAHPPSYLDAAHKLLRPEGRLIVQVPNAASWQSRLLRGRWNGADVPRHLFQFRDSDLELLLDSCGFEVMRRKYFSLRDNPAGLTTSIAPSLDPMARQVRGMKDGVAVRLVKDLLYFGISVAGLPFTILEAVFHAGSTIMIEARKKR